MKLNKFHQFDILAATKALFTDLKIPVNYVAEEPTTAKEILQDTYKENEAFQLINDVYFVGMVDDAAFNKTESIAKEKIKSDYDGILLFAITLHQRNNNLIPSRSQLAEISRAFNREFYYTPVVIVFKYKDANNEYIAFSNTERLQYKQAWREGEKAGKVSLLRDINIAKPHAGHERIIDELRIPTSGKNAVDSFDRLYKYWQDVFSVSILNKRFYQELQSWYFWAIKEVTFPNAPKILDKGIDGDAKKFEEALKEHKGKNVIRLLTRILFIWFIKEKKLIPDEIFDEDYIAQNLLKDFTPQKPQGVFATGKSSSMYYRAILQNLFFATLNQEMGKREFRKDKGHMNVTNLMRYKDYFKENGAEEFVQLMESVVPFMNGGLFECLDKPHPTVKGKQGGDLIIHEDGFSDRPDNVLQVPDYLFFDVDEEVDISDDIGSKNKIYKQAKTKGLLELLKSYKFTITENTPIEEDVALDPELLGKVFENLLASYNPETKTTARKQTGSFYTPREIVNYMVDESLIAYLKNKILEDKDGYFKELGSSQFNLFGNNFRKGQLTLQEQEKTEFNNNEELLDILLHQLVSFDPGNPFENYPKANKAITKAIDACKILDPACGSGAFPMGTLQKMVHILHKVDPNNSEWKQRQIDRVDEAIEKLEDIDDVVFRERSIKELEAQKADIEESFNNNELDYGRKLYLIENCIYGVDIQSIATQISKLRFFISLVVDQKIDRSKSNFGVRPLPNLETKFVAANTLIGIDKPKAQGNLFDNAEVKKLEDKLKKVRHKLFSSKSPKRKRELREEDKKLRNEIADMLEQNGWANTTARQLASWDPYDQNATSSFFDSEWMFDISNGFDVVIGNPPYVNFANLQEKERKTYKKIYKVNKNKTDLFAFFIEKGGELCNASSVLSFIIPHTWKATDSFTPLRELIFRDFKFLSIVDLNFGVFDAIVKPVVIVLKKNKIEFENKNYKINVFDEKFKNVTYVDVQEVLSSRMYELDTLSSPEQKRIFKLVEGNNSTLDKTIEFSRGIKTSDDTRFISKNNNAEEYHPVYRGKNIKAYKLNWAGEYIWYRPDLMREKVGCVPHTKDFFEVEEKIVTQRVNSSYQLLAAYDNKQNYFLDTVNVSRYSTFNKACSLRSICSILNSKLINFWYCLKYRMPTIGIYELHSIPIVTPDKQFDHVLSTLTSILTFINLKESSLFKTINDGVVFNLYFPEHMQEKEIDVIEFVEEDLKTVLQERNFEQLDENSKSEVIEALQKKWTHPDNEVRNRIKLFAVRSPEILKPILEN